MQQTATRCYSRHVANCTSWAVLVRTKAYSLNQKYCMIPGRYTARLISFS